MDLNVKPIKNVRGLPKYTKKNLCILHKGTPTDRMDKGLSLNKRPERAEHAWLIPCTNLSLLPKYLTQIYLS